MIEADGGSPADIANALDGTRHRAERIVELGAVDVISPGAYDYDVAIVGSGAVPSRPRSPRGTRICAS